MAHRDDLRKAALSAEFAGQNVREPVWGGNVFAVRGLSIKESNKLIDAVTDDEGKVIDRDRMIVQALIATVVDPETGDPVFEQADAETLLNGPRPAEVMKYALRLAGLGGEAQADEAVEGLKETPDDEPF